MNGEPVRVRLRTDDILHPTPEDLVRRPPEPVLVAPVHEAVDMVPVDERDQHRQGVGDDLKLVPDAPGLAFRRRRLGPVAQDLEEAHRDTFRGARGIISPLAQNWDPSLRKCQRSSDARPVVGGAPHLGGGTVGHPVLRREEGRGWPTEHFPGRPAQNALCTRVPGGDPPLAVAGDDGEGDGAVEDLPVVSRLECGALLAQPRHLRLQFALAPPEPLDLKLAHRRASLVDGARNGRAAWRGRHGFWRQRGGLTKAEVIKLGNRRKGRRGGESVG